LPRVHLNWDNAGFHPDAKLLGLLSTKYVISQFPLEEPGLSLLKSSDYLWLYENEYVLPFAWVIPSADTTIIDRTPNRISISTSGPGQLVLSEVIYPGWVAAMDGTPAPIATYQGLLRSVDVPAGRHEIIFSYQPKSLWIGMAISAVTILALLGYTFVNRRKRNS